MTELQTAVSRMMGACADCGVMPEITDTDEECRIIIESDARQKRSSPRLHASLSRIRTVCETCQDKREGRWSKQREAEKRESFIRSQYATGQLPAVAQGRTFSSANPARCDTNRSGWNEAKEWARAQDGNLWVYGPPGIGKTHMSHCITNDLLSRGVTVLEKYAREINDMGGWTGKGRAFQSCLECRVLIIQDIDKPVWTPEGLDVVAELFERRQPNKTVITSAVDLETMMQRWKVSESLHASLWHRINPMEVISMAGAGAMPARGRPAPVKTAAVFFDHERGRA